MPTAVLDWTGGPPPGFARGAVTVGNFDGVHRGHRELVAVAARWAKRVGGPAVAVTFDPPPYQVLVPDAPPRPPLTTLADRAELLHAAGADRVVVLRTTAELLGLPPEEFVSRVLVRLLGARAVVEGYDFRFGRGRAGDTAALRRLCAAAGIGFEEVPPLADGGEPVSSSRVRAAIVAGDVAKAAGLLGRPYRIAGTVVGGAKRGRTIGFPTANLGDVPTVVPGTGVYAVRATADGATWPAAANVGPNPTFGEDTRKIEAHLIDFAGDLYGQGMTVEFVQKLRDTRPFAGPAELVEQLRRDVAAAKVTLGAS
ncbi:MAG: bifunctional riboflavin kinase/FAD synthetase [Gemmataceae bacterium]|nr:bifunctional riboflavin kinase/FAD synthetase [Gemmataceae bacterium]